MRPTSDILTLTAHLPEVRLAAGDVVVHEGTPSGGIWVLVEGNLRVMKGDVQVNVICNPGALVGEMSVLLNSGHGATVEATEATTMRYAADGASLLAGEPAITHHLAVGLAERLNFVTAYLADLEHQYGGAPGLTMVSEVLTQLTQRQGPPAQPGSARDPDPEY